MKCVFSLLVKYIMFIFNVIYMLGGSSMIIFGVIAKKDIPETMKSMPEVSEDFISNTSNVIIVLGSLISIIAFFGCWGAIKENTLFLKTYAIILLSIFVSQIVLTTVILGNNIFDTSNGKDIFILSDTVFISLAVVELLGAIFAFYLSNSIRKNRLRRGFV
ncbi:tetraspanin-9-like [Onthophagus taurus]|uniref:tetraspanin-9-like n=1 Tax=Onthophagus taurus TaxID=166361 RepID=UPI0039BDD090